jgi:hypothetical protein
MSLEVFYIITGQVNVNCFYNFVNYELKILLEGLFCLISSHFWLVNNDSDKISVTEEK